LTVAVATAEPPEARGTVVGFYVLSGLYTLSAAAIWGVNTLFLLSAGLSFFEVFVANAAYSFGTVMFEIPTGVVADTLGRRASFLLSVSVLAVSTLLYVGLAQVDAGVVAFALASILMALGFTFYSGAMEAWVVDALNATGYRGVLDHVFARGQQVTGAAMLVGTIGGGLLGQVDLSIPYLIRAVLLAAVFAVAFFVMHDVGFTPRRVPASRLPFEIAQNAKAGVAFGWAQRPIRLLMLAAALESGFLIWAFYACQPYLLDLLDSDAIWIAGVVAAGIALSTMVGNQIVDVVSRRCAKRTTLLLWAGAAQSVAAILTGLANSFWIALPALFVLMGAAGVTGPVRQAYLHQLIPSEQRATVISFDSMVSGGGGVVGQVGLGALGEARSVGAAFVTGGIATTLALPFFAAVRRIGGVADQIVGRVAGVDCGSAGKGLPHVAQVEPTAVEDLRVPAGVSA
jgi:MFS family permease